MGVESPPGTGRKGRHREGGRAKGMEVQRSQVLLLAGFRGIWGALLSLESPGGTWGPQRCPRYPPGREGNGGGSHLECRYQDEVELGLGVV